MNSTLLIQYAQRLADQAAAQDHALTDDTYRAARDFFLACAGDPDYLADFARLTPEFGRDEFLAVVDHLGQTLPASAAILADFRAAQAAHPAFAAWFQEAPGPTLLAARWLCHLAGFRHKTVHLFIDPPALAGTTLIQVRASDRPESPGCFDIAVAGHVSGLLDDRAALYKELGEELALSPDAVVDVARLGAYTQYGAGRPPFRNAEYHTVYRCRLTPAGWAAVRTSDEVAAIALFSVNELVRLKEMYPERFAPAITDSLRYYI